MATITLLCPLRKGTQRRETPADAAAASANARIHDQGTAPPCPGVRPDREAAAIGLVPFVLRTSRSIRTPEFPGRCTMPPRGVYLLRDGRRRRARATARAMRSDAVTRRVTLKAGTKRTSPSRIA
jgi:hypothetical protein